MHVRSSNCSILGSGPSLLPRVELVVDRAQARLQHVRVNLRRRQIGVAQHHLDGPEIGAAFEQMRRERVPQHVRAQLRARRRP